MNSKIYVVILLLTSGIKTAITNCGTNNNSFPTIFSDYKWGQAGTRTVYKVYPRLGAGSTSNFALNSDNWYSITKGPKFMQYEKQTFDFVVANCSKIYFGCANKYKTTVSIPVGTNTECRHTNLGVDDPIYGQNKECACEVTEFTQEGIQNYKYFSSDPSSLSPSIALLNNMSPTFQLQIQQDQPIKYSVITRINLVQSTPTQVDLYRELELIVIVCGNEQINIVSSVQKQYIGVQTTGDSYTYPGNNVPTHFVLATQDHADCQVVEYKIMDSTCTGSVTGTQIIKFSYLAGPPLTQTFKVDLNLGFPEQTIGIRAKTNGLSENCVQFKVEVCGHESVTFNIPETEKIVLAINSHSGQYEIQNIKSSFFKVTGSTNCLIETVTLHDSPSLDPLGAGIPVSYSSLTDKLSISTTNYLSSQIAIKGVSKGGKIAYKKLKIRVGTLTLSAISNGLDFHFNKVAGKVNILIENVQNLFLLSNGQKNGVSFSLEEDKAGQFISSTFSALRIVQVSNTLSLDTSGPINSVFYLVAKFQTQVERIPLSIEVCGYDKVSMTRTKETTEIFVENLSSDQESFQDFYSFDSDFSTNSTFCQPSYRVITEQDSDFIGTNIRLDQATKQIQIDSSKSQKPLKVGIKADNSDASNSEVKMFEIEVCGWETIELSKESQYKEVNISETQKNIIISFYLSFSSESLKCKINDYKLVQSDNNETIIGKLVSYAQGVLRVNLQRLDSYSAKLVVSSKYGTPFSFPIKVKILESEPSIVKQALINRPPFFDKGLESMYTFNTTEKNPYLSYAIGMLPMDDYGLCCIKFKSLTLGTAGYYLNGSHPLLDQKYSPSNFLSFNGSALLIQFSDFGELKKVPEEQKILVELVDQDRLSLIKTFSIKFNIEAEDQTEEVFEKIEINKTAQNQNETFLGIEIEDINENGQVIIKFNQSMQSQSMNLTHINQTLMDLYINPYNDWHLEQDKYNISRLNFTWKATNYTQEKLILQLNFISPSSISQRFFIDDLVVHFKEGWQSLFRTSQNYKSAESKNASLSLESPIPKQVQITEKFLQSKKIANILKKVSLGMMILCLVIDPFIAGIFSKFLGMINLLQIVFHIPMLRIMLPANLETLMGVLLPIFMFDIVGEFELLEQIFSASIEDANKYKRVFYSLRYYKFESFNLFLNMSTIGILAFAYFVAIFLHLAVFRPSMRRSSKARRLVKYFDFKLFFNSILSLIINGFFDFVIPPMLLINAPEESIDHEGWQLFLSYKSLIFAFFVLPALQFWVFFQKTEALNSNKKLQRLKPIFEIVDYKHKKKLFYSLLCIHRRLVLVFLIYVFTNTLSYQILGLGFLNLFCFAYFGFSMPLKGREANRIELMNEISTQMLLNFMLCFSDFVIDEETRYLIGYIVYGIIVFMLVFNLSILSKHATQAFILIFQKYKKRYNKLKGKQVDLNKIQAIDPDVENPQNSLRKRMSENAKKLAKELKLNAPEEKTQLPDKQTVPEAKSQNPNKQKIQKPRRVHGLLEESKNQLAKPAKERFSQIRYENQRANDTPQRPEPEPTTSFYDLVQQQPPVPQEYLEAWKVHFKNIEILQQEKRLVDREQSMAIYDEFQIEAGSEEREIVPPSLELVNNTWIVRNKPVPLLQTTSQEYHQTIVIRKSVPDNQDNTSLIISQSQPVQEVQSEMKLEISDPEPPTKKIHALNNYRTPRFFNPEWFNE